MTRNPYTIGVFLKNPHTCNVKTRLAKDIGQEKAKTLYLGLVEIIFNTLREFPKERIRLSVAGGLEHLVVPFPVEHQADGNLGERMASFFKNHLSLSHKVILIGSDCPYAVADSMHQAIAALDESDVVIQPAIDGGYTLIGMNQFHEDLFAKMPWSTERLFQASLDVLKSMDITYSLLELQRDIDTLDDLHIWLNNGGRQMLEKVMPGWELGL